MDANKGTLAEFLGIRPETLTATQEEVKEILDRIRNTPVAEYDKLTVELKSKFCSSVN